MSDWTTPESANLGFHAFLIADKLLLHQQVVFDALLLKELETTAGVWSHVRKLVSRIGTPCPLLPFTHSGRDGRLIPERNGFVALFNALKSYLRFFSLSLSLSAPPAPD